jgi:hypothetical protein
VATEDFLFIIIEIATLLGVVEDLLTFTFDKVDEKSTQEQLTIKTACWSWTRYWWVQVWQQKTFPIDI